MTAWIVVGLAGALGATSRHAVDIGLRRWFPKGPSIGILVVNLLGSFVLGIVVGVVATRTMDENLRLGVAAGFCGAFTTFSTFAAELAGLVNDRNHRMLVQWTAMMAPAATPAEILTRLQKEIVAILRLQDLREKLAVDGAEIVAGTPEELTAFMRAETVKWAAVVKAAGIPQE